MQAGEHINKPTLAQEYAILDKAATASETYLKNRHKNLDEVLENLHELTEAKDQENKQLEAEIAELQRQIDMAKDDPKKSDVMFEIMNNEPQRMQRIRRRNRIIQKIKDQQDVMMKLQEQLENYMHKSFPSLG